MKTDKYIFTSERLGFRHWSIEDLDEFAQMNADEAVMEHFPNTLSRQEVEQLMADLKKHYEENGFTYYATEILETEEFIGMVGLAMQSFTTKYTPAVDIGWRLKQSAWGKGYATEAAKRCLNHAFTELGLQSIIAICTVKNTKSERVMKKIGMTKIGEFMHPDLGAFPDYQKHHCYQITKEKV